MKPHFIVDYGGKAIEAFNSETGVKTDISFSDIQQSTDRLDVGPSVNNGDYVTPNPFSYSLQRLKAYKGFDNKNFYNGSYERSYGVIGNYPFQESNVSALTPDIDLTYNMALSKLNDKLRSSVDLSIDLVQAKQTADMFGTITPRLKALAEIIRKHRLPISRADAKDWRTAFVMPAGFWLEIQYGWKPLLSDVYDTMDNLQNHVIKKASELSERATLPYPVSSSVKSSFIPGHTDQCKIKGIVSTTISCETLVDIDSKAISNFTSLNPLSIAYEAMPYSFVFDWFIDIGGFIRNVETSLLYNASIGKKTVSQIDAVDIAVSCYKRDIESSYKRDRSVVAGYSHVIFRRTVPNLLLPRKPSFKANLGSSRLLSAAALLAQLLKR